MTHIYTYPDCPHCHKEMQKVSRYTGPADDEHPFGTGKLHWWYCPRCGATTTEKQTEQEALDEALKWAGENADEEALRAYVRVHEAELQANIDKLRDELGRGKKQ